MISFDYSIYVTTEVHEDGKSFLLENRIHRHDAADTSSSRRATESCSCVSAIYRWLPWRFPWGFSAKIIDSSIICGYATLVRVLL